MHTGDFKVDYTPIESDIIDLARFGELGNRGVLALMSDFFVSGDRGRTDYDKVHGSDSYRAVLVHGHSRQGGHLGFEEDSVIIGSIGNVIETNGVDMKITGQVPAGRVFVDGLGVGDVGSIVLRARRTWTRK